MKKLLMSVLMAAALPASALAQAWPDKPVTVVVPFGAGGGVDAAARIVMPKLAERLGQQVVIDNVPGASGTIGTQRVAKAKADGTTLLFAVASPINVAPLVAPASVRYDALKDLAPIAPVAVSPFVLVGKLGLPAANTAELLALARKQPGKLTYGTDGFGTSLHVTAAMITATAGVDILHVPYKSGPQVLTDVAGGQVDLGVLPVALVQGMVKEGKVKAYGVTSKARSDALPGVPSLSETPALATLDVDSWMGSLARPAWTGHRRAAEQGSRGGAGRPGGAEAAGRWRREADADGAGRVRCLPGQGAQGAVERGRRQPHQGGVDAPTPYALRAPRRAAGRRCRSAASPD